MKFQKKKSKRRPYYPKKSVYYEQAEKEMLRQFVKAKTQEEQIEVLKAFDVVVNPIQ